MRQHSDIAIIGLSGIFPGAANVRDFWNNILQKVDAIQPVPANRIDAVFFDTQTAAVDRFYCGRGGFIDEYASFDPMPFGILPLAVEGTEPEHLLALQLAQEALKDAGVFDKQLPLGDTGIIIGKGNYSGPAATRAIEIVRTGEQLVQLLQTALPHLTNEELQQVKRSYQLQKGRFTPDTAMGLIPNLVASLVANRLNLGGAAYTVDAACASSLLAVDQAIYELTSGRCNMVIAGGVHACQNAPFWSIFNQLGALSKQQQIRPFDTKADGVLIGEGCGFVVLKKLEDALRDGHTVYAVIKGTGVSSDGAGVSVMSPSVKGQNKAITQAWQKAGLDVQQVGYIEAHGTGTPLGDKTELETLRQVFGFNDALPRAGIGTVKSMIGHAMPAAGIAGLIKTALALYHGKLPPTLHCDDPLPLMQQTRFTPVTAAVDWDATGLPRRAGVNAFGFGGINAHVVLEGFNAQPPAVKKSIPVNGFAVQKDKILLLARNSLHDLIQALEKNETATGEGNYRLALFDPTPERIRKAIKIVGKDKPWRNRQDTWFTNEPLLQNGGKTAFLFPGLDGLASGETDSVAAYFNIPSPAFREIHADSLLHGVFAATTNSGRIDKALKQLGVLPDVIAGHSLGEWLGWSSAGIVEEASVLHLLQQLNPAAYKLENSRFLAVGCGHAQLQPLLDEVGDVYLSNDNCPQQVIVCGTPAAIDQLMALLQQQQIFHQLLPFQSGFHSPFAHEHLDLLFRNFDTIRFKEGHIPLWSATTLQPYPTGAEAIRELTVQHLTHTVRFRELTERLYEQGVRVFIQAGAGGLVGFIDDTLKQKQYSAIAASVPLRSGIQQLQRVLAALFVEGKEVNPAFMDLPAPTASRAIKLQLGSPIVKDWSVLKERLATTQQAVSRKNSTPLKELALEDLASPLMQTLQENFGLMEAAQDEVIALLKQSNGKSNKLVPRQATNNTTTSSTPQPANGATHQPVNLSTFAHPLQVSLENSSYLLDHALMRQKPGWQQMEDLEPVIPMTMTLELLAEAAATAAPGKRVQQISQVRVFQWMSVATPFHAVIQGEWKNRHTVSLLLEKFAEAHVVLGDDDTAPLFTSLDIGAAKNIQLTPKQIYDRHMFHGKAYQGIREIVSVGEKGIRGIIEHCGGKGSLLDNAGQLFGLWLQLHLPTDRIAFPVSIREVNFYGDYTAQQGRFECTCVLTSLSDEFATADFILKQENRVWAIIRGWQNRRLEIDDHLWLACLEPLHRALSTEIEPGVFFFNNRYQRVSSWNFVLKRYFSQSERQYRESLAPQKQKPWAISRIAVKDAVRHALLQHKQLRCYQNEFSIQSDDTGRPFVNGEATAGIHVSLAHKGTDAVGIARYGEPVGIDIELIAERSEGFNDMVFTPGEWNLIAARDLPEWTTRCWVAKEAYGKYLGEGLRGNPKRYEISEIKGNDLRINHTWITTIQYQNYIIGWTI